MKRGVAPSESGLALVVLLIVALFVGLVGVAMMNATVGEVQIAVNQSNAVQARYLAEAGIAAMVNQLTRDNTWTTTLTSSVPGGQGSYTVSVNTTLSNTALKVIDSTGSVLSGTAAGATQTVRETFLVLPQAFSKAIVSNTTLTTAAVAGITPSIQDTVLRQLGTIHANNLRSAATSITLAAGTQAVGQVTASSGTINLAGICIACASANNVATIPFPSFNFTTYSTLATNNPSPCPCPCPPGIQNNTLFTTEANFDNCITAITADASGYRTINGVWFANFQTLTLPNVASEKLLKVYGTIVVSLTSGGACNATTPCGDLKLVSQSGSAQNITITSRNGEPAVMLGGSLFTSGAASAGTVTINGLVYILANTTAPVTSAPFPPGYSVIGSSSTPVTINGMVLGQILSTVNSNAITYDPSSFFPGLPTGLVTPTSPPFVPLPISWSSSK